MQPDVENNFTYLKFSAIISRLIGTKYKVVRKIPHENRPTAKLVNPFDKLENSLSPATFLFCQQIKSHENENFAEK